MTRAVIGNLRVNLGVDTGQFSAGLQAALRQLGGVTKQMQALGRQMSATLTAPLALVGTSTLRTAADFEQAMSNMAAVLRPTQEEFKALEDRVIALAQTTRYTAKEAADGMEMLARNGINAANILGGAAEATLNLASAANASLPSAADAMTDIMSVFRKTGNDLTDIVNNIAGTLVNSKLDWDGYHGALSKVAGTAKEVGVSFSDVNAVLAATAPAFKGGEENGTSFNGFLLRLAPSSKQAKEIMKDLNLQFFDAQGFMKSMAEVAEELRTKLGHLTKQSQLEVLGTLFGQRTIRTALGLMRESGEGIDKFREKIAQGDAEAMAKTRLDNFWGSWNMLRAAVESAAIAIGKSGLKQWARNAVDAIAEIARNVAVLNPELLRWGTIMAGIAAAAGPAILAAGLFAAAIGAVSLPVAATIAEVAVVIGTIAAFSDELRIALRVVANAVQGMYEAIKGWLVDKFGWVADGIRAIIDDIVGMFKWLADKMGLTALARALEFELGATVRRVGNDMKMFKKIGGDAADWVSEKWSEASRQLDEERKAFEGWTNALESRARMMGRIFENEAERALGTWSGMAAKMNDDALKAGLPRPSDIVDLGLFGEGTYDSTQHDDANRIIKGLGKTMSELESEAERVRESIRTPLETFQHELKNLNGLVQSGSIGFGEYERAVANLQDEFSGITQAAEILSQSFGNAFENMLLSGAGWRDTMSSLLQDVARDILRLSVVTPMMDSIKGGITSAFGAGGGGLGSLFSFLPGFATGGSFQVGGAGGIDSQLVAFRASPNERVSITKPGQGSGGAQVVLSFAPQVDARGADVAAVTRLENGLQALSRNFEARVAKTLRDTQNGKWKI